MAALAAAALTLLTPAVARASVGGPPVVGGTSASAITSNSATINTSINPEGHSTSYYVRYWSTAGLFYSATASAGSGTTPVTVHVALSGLTAKTVYGYRVIATNLAGKTASATNGFTTTSSSTSGGGTGGTGGTWQPELYPQTVWTPGTVPLTDAQAAALVTPEPEVRPANATANNYVPTTTQLAAFYASTPAILNNPLRQYVTGRPGIPNPTTDELIQWTAHKWGIPEDWIRAEMVVESNWKQSAMGDLTAVPSSWYSLYPSFSQLAGTLSVYQSLGLAQVKWLGDNSGIGAGTEPLRWQSTAFNLDFYASTVRWLYDGYTAGFSWLPNIYTGNGWNSIGGWYCGGCSGAQTYITDVQTVLAAKPWLQSGF